MIAFESITLRDFALYPELTLSFSTDSRRPLTVIRGENESGKTTLMRAFLWALFGVEALPDIPDAKHPVRPVWAEVGQTVLTRVEIRFHSRSERGVSAFKLSRSAQTRDDGEKVKYSDERVVLLKREGDEWEEQHDVKLRILLRRFFRPEMRDFYFIDADKAVEFVGGPEGRHDKQLMRRTTTTAVRGLLGLDVLLKTAARLDDRATDFRRLVGRNSSDAAQRELAAQLEDKASRLEAARQALVSLQAEEDASEAAFQTAARDLESDLANLEAIEGLTTESDTVESEFSDLRLRQSELLNLLSGRLQDERLFAALMLPALSRTVDLLDPLKEAGHIPASEVTVIPRLIERGTCLCGADLSTGTTARRHLEAHVSAHRGRKEEAIFLDGVLENARRLGNTALGGDLPPWDEDVERVFSELSSLDTRIEELALQRDALREEREQRAGSVTVLREKQKHRDSLKEAWESARFHREEGQAVVTALTTEVRSLGERIRTASAAETRTQAASAAAQVAEDARAVLDRAYRVIEEEQVDDVSRAMNKIFRDIISATDASLFGEVGIRRAKEAAANQGYEPYALEDGREKPLALANGASRRAIAVAFVLALAEQTGSKVPFVADSLLHAMSGSVRRKLVDSLTSGQRVGQPILFGTRADLLDPEVLELVKSRAGQSYTLTSQTHAGGDVVRAVANARHGKQVVACDCAVDEYCNACERLGDATRGLIGPRESKVMA